MTVEVRVASEADAAAWDQIVDDAPAGSLFHTWQWLRAAERHSGCRLHALIGERGSDPVAILPLFTRSSGPIRFVFSPPPHLALLYLGPVAAAGKAGEKPRKREENFAEFRTAVDGWIAEQSPGAYTSIGFPPGMRDPRPFAWAGYEIDLTYDYVNDLSGGSDAVWQNLTKNLRQDINRGEKRGITVEHGGREELLAIYRLMNRRYGEQAKAVTVPESYLLEVYDTFRDSFNIWVAKYEGEIATGIVDLAYRDEIWSWIGNPRPEKPISPSPNDIVSWHAMKAACEAGKTKYVTMGAAGDERLHAYYSSKFNPELRVRYIAKKVPFVARQLERAYTRVVKPLAGRLRRR